MYQDLSMCHDWSVKNATVNLPISLKWIPVICLVHWWPWTRALLCRCYYLGLDYACYEGCVIASCYFFCLLNEKSCLLLLLVWSCHEKRWSNLVAMKKSFHSVGIGSNTCLKHWSLKSWFIMWKHSQSEVSLSCKKEIAQLKENLVSLKPYTYFIMFVKRSIK